MTTIVYRDGILASDRQMAQTSVVHGCDVKIAVVDVLGQNDVAIAYAGHATLGLAFMEWVHEGSKPGEFPVNIGDKEYFYGLLVRPAPVNDLNAKPIVEYWDTTLFPLDETDNPYSAQGAGTSIAIGALYQGATAIEAICAANHHSPDSGFGVLYIDMNNRSNTITGQGQLEVKRAPIVRVE